MAYRLSLKIKLQYFLLVSATLIILYCIYNLSHHSYLHSIWMDERKELIVQSHNNYQLHKINNSEKLSGKNEPACVVPNLDPFNKEVIQLMEKVYGKCNLKVYGDIIDGVYILKGVQFTDVNVQYIRRARKKGEINDDSEVSYSPKIPLTKNKKDVYELKLEEDHIKVSMIIWDHNVHFEFHTHVVKTKERLEKYKKLTDLTSGIPMNIALLMFDSQSRGSFQRQTLQTMEYLQADKDTVILEGHSIVGDGTTAQLSAMLTGIAEKEQPESRRGFPDTEPCDRFNWIFKDLHKAGYMTAFSEDDATYSSFNYRLNGFTKPPTTWYLRPYWLANNPLRSQNLCSALKMMGFSKQFNEMFPEHAKFSIFTIALVCHNYWNNMQLVDEPIVELAKYFKSTGNTMFIIFGDHGPRTGGFRDSLQGKMEERLPFFSITMPTFFKRKYPNMFNSLKENSLLLTSHFDIYTTFRHVLSYPDYPSGNLIGQSLFTKIDPDTRTCASAGVDEHWCPCLDFTSLSPSNPEVIKIATAIVKYINQNILLKLGENIQSCAKLRIEKIISAGVRTPKEIVQKFSKTKRNEKCDSCGIILDESIEIETSSIKIYELIFVTSPNQGKFEANAKREHDGTIIVDPNISRINLYGDQPKCIMDKFPHARPFCYCV